MSKGVEERRQRLNRVIKQSLLCVVAGPPVGLVVMLVLSTLYGLVAPTARPISQTLGPLEIAGGVGYLFVGGFLISYVLGGVQAVFVGGCFGLYDWLKDELPMWLAIVSGAFSSLFVAFIFGFGVLNMGEMGFLMLVHVLSAMVCWTLARRLRRKLMSQ
ncbi:MAG: hypothetical protein AAF299_09485 [Pseudomonadota bacterium]